MPTYEYQFSKCRKRSTLSWRVKERDSNRAKYPKCGTRKLNQLIGPFYTQTSSRS